MSEKLRKHNHMNDISYEEFILQNRIKTNSVLNGILWLSSICGPAAAIGITLGIFTQIVYLTCIIVSIVLIFLSGIHFFLCKKFPASMFTSYFALLSFDCVIVYLAKMHAPIAMVYFLVPLVSILFIDRKTFYISCIGNYFIMLFSLWFISDYQAALRTNFDTSTKWLFNTAGVLTIETVIMIIAGNSITKTMGKYLKRLYDNQQLLVHNEKILNEQLQILNSMSDIYSTIQIIDFTSDSIVSFDSSNSVIEKIILEKQHHSEINHQLSNQIINNQINEFLNFTDHSTIQQRMKKQKLLSAEFLSTVTGWIRLQFISLDIDSDLVPTKIIYTIQDIDEEKQREEHLKNISNTDPLTRLFNRRAYDDDIKIYENQNPEKDFIIFSLDVNGLKVVNDNLGHDAGDELLKGASFSILAVLGHYGKVYRTGGDEFLAILHTTEDCEMLKNQLIKMTKNWHGSIIEDLSISIGYARSFDHPNANLHQLEKMADENMYKDKVDYYTSKGINRLGQQAAFIALGNIYEKILKINLTDDTYSIIKMNMLEQKEGYGFEDKLSTWLSEFANAGLVHPDNIEEYRKITDLEYLRDYFTMGNTSLRLFYSRKVGKTFSNVMMEILPAENFSIGNMEMFMYIKKLDV